MGWILDRGTRILHAAAAAKLLQSCPTLCDPIDGSPLPRPWDSPGKNTGVGCHFLFQGSCMPCDKNKIKIKTKTKYPALPCCPLVQHFHESPSDLQLFSLR